MTSTAWAAVILAGGDSRRLGRDKLAEVVGGSTLLDRVLRATSGAAERIVVGPPRAVADTSGPVTWCREDPPGGGPAAALAAGIRCCTTGDHVAVLAGDLAFVTGTTVEHLRRLLSDAPGPALGAVALDGEGREQLLLGVWSVVALRDAIEASGPLTGTSLRALLTPVPHLGVRVDSDGRDTSPAWLDCDTEADLARARRILDAQAGERAVATKS